MLQQLDPCITRNKRCNAYGEWITECMHDMPPDMYEHCECQITSIIQAFQTKLREHREGGQGASYTTAPEQSTVWLTGYHEHSYPILFQAKGSRQGHSSRSEMPTQQHGDKELYRPLPTNWLPPPPGLASQTHGAFNSADSQWLQQYFLAAM